MRNDFRMQCLLGIAVAVCVSASTGFARTWYVAQDGSGDAPTIWAANDSAEGGDTVLVGPGTHQTDLAIRLKNGVVIISEQGPFATRLVPEPPFTPSNAFVFVYTGRPTEVSGFWIEGFVYCLADDAPISIVNSEYVHITNNVLINNGGKAIATINAGPAFVIIRGNTLVNSGVLGNPSGAIESNIILGRIVGPATASVVYCNCMLNVADAGDDAEYNFESDPEFCGSPENGNLFLQSDSPCAPGNAPPPMTEFCGPGGIGALPVGCGTSPVESTTWGSIKSLYK
jgi:hypothetical protein